jgi:hypothetical protein
MSNHIDNRPLIINALRSELMGPDPRGVELDCASAIYFDDWNETHGPYVQKGSREEILLKDTPRIRYGVGVLYPIGATVEEKEEAEAVQAQEVEEAEKVRELASKVLDSIQDIAERNEPYDNEASDDFSLASANQMQQSCIGISFLAEVPKDAVLVVEATGGRYLPKQVQIASANKKLTWWLRESVKLRSAFSAEQLHTSQNGKASQSEFTITGGLGLDLSVEAFSRPVAGFPEQRLLTVALVNRTKRTSSLDAACLFQCQFNVWFEHEGKQLRVVLPYPEALQNSLDDEEKGISLLYQSHKTFAIGHGCAANWEEPDSLVRKTQLTALCLPAVELPSTTSDVVRGDGTIVEVSMAVLAGLEDGNDGFSELEEVVSLYREWIATRSAEIPNLPDELQSIAQKHLNQCSSAASRMENGLAYLRQPAQKERALKAFKLANHAILLQQINGNAQRQVHYDSKSKRLVMTPGYTAPDVTNTPAGRGKWRAFQIAFLLLSLVSVADGNDSERELVELIWFPTGGGKTEAYLGLAAFAMFLRRIDNPADDGVQVLMRYTLRLLTAQQFQRAAGLTCAMDYLRMQPENSELGTKPYTIGIWVGGDTTPNNNDNAKAALNKLRKSPRAENPFLITRCPWCGAYLGQLKERGLLVRDCPVVGYIDSNTVTFQCPDRLCPFGKTTGLPIFVIDEAIYQERPSLVIGTVDKFAQLTWKPEARRLFGIDSKGKRETSPPNLIIQDELHLISGPLGSMVGFYETLIEELCTDRRSSKPVKPKIVCSTATIRRFEQQIKAIFNRDVATLFPPPGLDSGDSFFANQARDSNGSLLPGKIYIGIHAPSMGSMLTTQVRVNSALLQAPVDLPADEADPWWTLLIFFNSIRELGGALTLFQSDIPERLDQLRIRMGRDYPQMRQLWRVEELTSRLRNDEVPEAIRKLQEVYPGKPGVAIDVCLASNIIEVGVDIDRLSIMSVVGQPKTTSQYIQVTGRVGRRQYERPGIVVTIYNPSKPRDRSHFEKFKTYHERLYAQVEPTSVTPFSPPLLDRALHALMVAYVRQTGDFSNVEKPYPCPEEMIKNFWNMLRTRVRDVDPVEEANLQKVVQERANEWKRWSPGAWKASKHHPLDFLLRAAGEYVPSDVELSSWPTPTSLRNVDAECQAQISQLYLSQSNVSVLLTSPDDYKTEE